MWELETAICQHAAVRALEKKGVRKNPKPTFFYYSFLALYDDIVSRLAKVLDRTNDSAGFWYVQNHYQIQVADILKKHGRTIESFERLAKSVRLVRDRTLFHIDRRSVANPRQVWTEAGLTRRQLIVNLNALWLVLHDLHIQVFQNERIRPPYSGSDAGAIQEVWERHLSGMRTRRQLLRNF